MNNLKDIYNTFISGTGIPSVVILDFNENLLQKYKKNRKYANLYEYILLFQKNVLPLQQQI